MAAAGKRARGQEGVRARGRAGKRARGQEGARAVPQESILVPQELILVPQESESNPPAQKSGTARRTPQGRIQESFFPLEEPYSETLLGKKTVWHMNTLSFARGSRVTVIVKITFEFQL